ncbi:DUF5683 domain-containing protein [Flavobacterium sp.]|uniref:DUF5683 domain-containing protein n=1 Tax=Flavobacterium sp. TaxID=239 RepID=UPI0026236EEC|nr:DUF5683 domain-containing protein [Flavobacterium sp.]
MVKSLYITLFVLLFGSMAAYGQTQLGKELVALDSIKESKINPLAPAKAAFYSAIVPGLGQAYNKKYWKIPLVYGAMGTSIYFYINNNKKYNQYRDAYKRRLEGYTGDEFSFLDDSRLIAAQKFYQRNRDLSMLITGLFYILNIVDANVDAHLMQFNVNDKLTVKPDLYRNELTTRQNLGLSVTLKL